MTTWKSTSPVELATAFDLEHLALAIHKTDTERAVCRKYTNLIRQAPPDYVLAFARQMLFAHSHRWQAYEIIAAHQGAFHSLGADELEELGQGINSWWSVDSFARTLSGPAWRDGLASDDLFIRWAGSPDLWWRRAALVSTVAFNIRSQVVREMYRVHCLFASCWWLTTKIWWLKAYHGRYENWFTLTPGRWRGLCMSMNKFWLAG
jgi:hypothetical protein